jgi:hypothetical protein
MHQDSAGITQNNNMVCEVKTYSTGLPWLSVYQPADPLTQNFELRVTTNDYTLAGTHAVSLVVGFARSDLTMTLTQTFNVILISPCAETIVTSAEVIPVLEYYFGDPALQFTF